MLIYLFCIGKMKCFLNDLFCLKERGGRIEEKEDIC